MVGEGAVIPVLTVLLVNHVCKEATGHTFCQAGMVVHSALWSLYSQQGLALPSMVRWQQLPSCEDTFPNARPRPLYAWHLQGSVITSTICPPKLPCAGQDKKYEKGLCRSTQTST
jgi:hypothetical protein